MAVKGKLPPMKRAAGKAKAAATAGTTKKKAAIIKDAVKDAAEDAPLPQAVSKPKAHERHKKPSEAERIAKGKQLAAAYLMQRDGMDADTAQMVVGTMDAATINELNTEAATAVLEKSTAAAAPAPSAAPPSPADTGDTSAVPVADEAAAPAVDFSEVPALVAYETEDKETFAEVAIRCRDNAVLKNDVEKQYKYDKRVLDMAMLQAGIKKGAPVMVTDIKLTRYTGKSPKYLSDVLLLQAGVSPDVIGKCWVSKDYDDVRVYSPKEDE